MLWGIHTFQSLPVALLEEVKNPVLDAVEAVDELIMELPEKEESHPVEDDDIEDEDDMLVLVGVVRQVVWLFWNNEWLNVLGIAIELMKLTWTDVSLSMVEIVWDAVLEGSPFRVPGIVDSGVCCTQPVAPVQPSQHSAVQESENMIRIKYVCLFVALLMPFNLFSVTVAVKITWVHEFPWFLVHL